MRIGLVGYGKMGQEIDRVLGSHFEGQPVELLRIDPRAPEAHYRSLHECLESCAAKQSRPEVLIEFTHPEQVRDNIRLAVQAEIPIVVGTTGWADFETEAIELVESSQTALVKASNFSLGVALYLKALASAARLFARFEEYDVGGYEIHHNRKADSPSGTALSIVDVLLSESERKTSATFEAQHGERAPHELHFASLRVGEVPGTHVVRFESACDSIQLMHEARSRVGFARGAALAAFWIREEKGFWEFRDLLDRKLRAIDSDKRTGDGYERE